MNNRVAILAAFQNASYDTGNPLLMELVDYVRFYRYPNRGVNPCSSLAGVEGDPAYVQIPFRIETAAINGVRPVFETVTVSVVAVKTGEADFTVETFTINVPSCRLNNQQNINFQSTRGYFSYDNDVYNSISLSTDSTYDSGTKKGFVLQYGLVLRYDYWNSIVTANIGGSSCNTDINNSIENVNNSWSNLASAGWDLVFRFDVNITGYDGTITPFRAENTITCQNIGSLPMEGPAYSCEIYYYDEDGIIQSAPISGAKTRIRAKFTTNGTAVPEPNDAYWGSVYADLISGSPTTRRFADTEYTSESDSPFSDPGDLLGDILFSADGRQLLTADGKAIQLGVVPDSNNSSGNVRIAVYESAGQVVLETIYNDKITGWGQKGETILIVPRLGFKAVFLETADGEELLTSDGQQIIA